MNHSAIVSFLWGVADLIRDTFKRGKYQDVILPLTVLRRLDCVLADTKEGVLARQAQLKGKGLEDLDAQLRRASGFAFYNTSRYDFEKLLGDAPHLASNLRNFIAGFSPNIREVLEKFDFDNTISKLDEAGLLFQVLERFKKVDLHPDKIDNPTMGTIFEELLRKFNEALNENPGEHFTPRDVVQLMVDLMLAGDEYRIGRKGIVCTVYDPCCGSGGMLMISKEHVTIGLRRNGDILRPAVNPSAEIHLFGQESQPETWAVAKSDMFMKDPTGRDADNIAYGSTLSNDRHAGRGFDYLIANPPYGKDWKRDEDAVRAEHERGESKTLEFKSTLRWSLREDRQDDKRVTHAVLKTIAAFLNTEGGDLLIGVGDDGSSPGIERDQLESDDKFMRHLAQVVRNGLGDRAGTCIDPKPQVVQGKTVCIVSCQRSPEPVFLKWKGMEASGEGDFFVRSGPGTVKLPPGSAREYIRTRFGTRVTEGEPGATSDGAD